MNCCYHCGDDANMDFGGLDVHCEAGQGLPHCEDCVETCDLCDEIYCGDLIHYNGLLLCETCLETEKADTKTLIEKLIACIEIPGYWYTGQGVTDEATTLEYISSDNPKVLVKILKKSA